jgi:uncharacterized protein YjcR
LNKNANKKIAYEMYKEGIKLIDIADKLNLPPPTVRAWKSRYWENDNVAKTLKKNVAKTLQNESVAKGRGKDKKKRNGAGQRGNKNAQKLGIFSKYIPKETLQIMIEFANDPTDILWQQILISHAAIVRAQQIMFVEDRSDKTEEVISQGEKSESYSIQQAWDKHANFLKSQAAAQSQLRSMIDTYERMIAEKTGLKAEEQRAKIALMKANTESLKRETEIMDDGVRVINDVGD